MTEPTKQQLDFAQRLAEGGSLWAMDVTQRVTFDAKVPLSESVPVEEKTAGVVYLAGELTRHGSDYGTATEKVRFSIECLAADEDVDAILIRVNSPGGAVAGTADLADAVKAASAVKPTWAFVDDLCASAAYWVASQCDRIVVSQKTTMVGSVGTMAVILDSSRMMDRIGIEVIPVASGNLKTSGLFGTEITEEQREYFRDLISQTQQPFTEAVQTGRSIRIAGTDIETGRVFLAEHALRLGLIDSIDSLPAVLKQLGSAEKGRKVFRMAAATIQELRASLPNADDSFLLAQLEAGATMAQAKDAWMEHLSDEIARLKYRPAHGQRIEDGDGDGGGRSSYGSDFRDLVREQMAEGKSRAEAVRMASKLSPELYREFLIESNGPHSAALVDAIISR